MTLLCRRTGLATIVLLLTFAAGPRAAGEYSWALLAFEGGPEGFIATGEGWFINDSGQVAGTVRGADNVNHAVLWTPGGTDGIHSNPEIRDLGIVIQVLDLNNAGQLVGNYVRGGNAYGFIWTRFAVDGLPANPEMKDIGTLGGGSTSTGYYITAARGMNDLGQVVGYSRTGLTDERAHAFVWTPGATDGVTGNPQMKDLGTFDASGSAAAQQSDAYDINNAGQVVGVSRTAESLAHAFLWAAGSSEGLPGNPEMKDLGTLGGPYSVATGINESGAVVGFSQVSDDGNIWHAFLWTPGATDGVPTNPQMKDLGTLGGRSSFPKAINGDTVVGYSDVVVGYQEYDDYVYDETLGYYVLVPVRYPLTVQRGFRYTPGTGMVDIGDPIDDPTSQVVVYSVNSTGQIAAMAWSVSGDNSSTRVYIATPPMQTPAGQDVTVHPVLPGGGTATQLVVTFGTITSGGTTSVAIESAGPPPPSGFRVGSPPLYYFLETTASFTGPATVCIAYPAGAFSSPNLRLFHHEGTAWVDRTSFVDPASRTICATVTSFSPFAIFQRAYTFSGFFSPVQNAPTTNRTKAGSAVPVKFSLGGDHGSSIFASGFPRFVQTSCGGDFSAVTIDEPAVGDDNRLHFDAAADQYIYTWKTAREWAGRCGRLEMRFNDGLFQTAQFAFVK